MIAHFMTHMMNTKSLENRINLINAPYFRVHFGKGELCYLDR